MGKKVLKLLLKGIVVFTYMNFMHLHTSNFVATTVAGEPQATADCRNMYDTSWATLQQWVLFHSAKEI